MQNETFRTDKKKDKERKKIEREYMKYCNKEKYKNKNKKYR